MNLFVGQIEFCQVYVAAIVFYFELRKKWAKSEQKSIFMSYFGQCLKMVYFEKYITNMVR